MAGHRLMVELNGKKRFSMGIPSRHSCINLAISFIGTMDRQYLAPAKRILGAMISESSASLHGMIGKL